MEENEGTGGREAIQVSGVIHRRNHENLGK